MSTILTLHDGLSQTMILFMAAVGVWGLFVYFRGGALSGSIAGALAIGQGLVIVQSLLGVALYLNEQRAPSSVHYLYGMTAVLALPFAWSYLRERDPRLTLLIFSLLALFVMGLGIRGVTTGGS